MISQSLFPSQQELVQSQEALLSFKAGKCHTSPLNPITGKVTVNADLRKGQISLERQQDGLLHFIWMERSSNRIEEDRIVFPGDVSFKKINTGRAADRVYVLRIAGSSAYQIYWMQDKDESKDSEHCTRFNDIVNDHNDATAPSQPDLIGNLDLSSLLAQFAVPAIPPQQSVPAPAVQSSVSSQSLGYQRQRPMSLENVLTGDSIIRSGILENPEGSLLPLLPPGQQTEQSLRETVRCPQFRQSLRSFSNALHSDGYNSIMANLGVDASPGLQHTLRGDNVRAMLTSIAALHPQQAPNVNGNNSSSGGTCDSSSNDGAATSNPSDGNK